MYMSSYGRRLPIGCSGVRSCSPTTSSSDSYTASSAYTPATSSPFTIPPSTSSAQPALSSSTLLPPSTVIQTNTTTKPQAGAIAGGVIGGVVFLVCAVLGVLIYLRARKRKRTAPSSEFMNSLKPGAAPVLRLDSGTEYAPVLSEKGGFTHYPHSVPLPQNSHHASSPMQNMKFPDAMIMTDMPSARPSIENPLHPQRFSAQHANDSFGDHAQPLSASAGSRRELWGSDTEIYAGDLSPARRPPSRGSDFPQTAPRYSSNEPSSQHSYFGLWRPDTSQESAPQETTGQQPLRIRPTSSLQPLRRQQDPEGM
ncbi:hypothetical protein BS17DRAFT_204038 [Gyrodon lividus]|nr:hypothetical protein BS17DRAFT_204038 [Gyrodon lividus]